MVFTTFNDEKMEKTTYNFKKKYLGQPVSVLLNRLKVLLNTPITDKKREDYLFDMLLFD
jgi:hypothetical protein